MPFGQNGEHVPVRLVDFSNPSENQLVVTNQFIFSHGNALIPVPSPTGRGMAEGRGEGRSGGVRFDVVFVVNGLPLVIGEAKTPTRSGVTWFDGAFQVHEIYEKQVPAMFVSNVFSFATEGKLFRYGSIRMPIDIWGPWRTRENEPEGSLADVRRTVESMLQPEVVLDILQSFTVFATDKKHRRIKIICRYQQYFTTNQLVERVVKGYPKKGLIWHFQGSGKSLLMVFAAQKLRLHVRLGNPTVIIVVDRIDLDTQITATFNAADVANMVGVESREELQGQTGADVLAFEVRIIRENLLRRHVPCQEFQNHADRIAQPAHGGLAVANRGINGDAFQRVIQQASRCQTSDSWARLRRTCEKSEESLRPRASEIDFDLQNGSMPL